MLIINADDWGQARAETDAALACYSAGRITSATAMVFMEDSERAAALAKNAGIDVGLHLNLYQPFTGNKPSVVVCESHNQVCRFLSAGRYALLLYNPFLRRQFRSTYQAQAEEFQRLYGRRPSHIDGHQHMHLCTNMLVDRIIPEGQKVRRNFSFWPGEKSALNRAYRSRVDTRLARKYRVTDYFFGLFECLKHGRLARVAQLAQNASVELMTHPAIADEYKFLMSDDFVELKRNMPMGTYGML